MDIVDVDYKLLEACIIYGNPLRKLAVALTASNTSCALSAVDVIINQVQLVGLIYGVCVCGRSETAVLLAQIP